MEISGKCAVVTGGASGMGAATVRRFLRAGARVAILDLDERRGGALQRELGSSTTYLPTDVSNGQSVTTAIERTEQAFGPIHICCNFAGIQYAARTVGRKGVFSLDKFEDVIRINLTGTFNVIRLVASRMIENAAVTSDGERGVIINTSSVAAFDGQGGQAAYSASKAGIVGLTMPIARDLAVFGIRVNTIVPGAIQTPMVDTSDPELLTKLTEKILFPRRLGHADEVAQLATFIVENGYINGACIRVDAGLRLAP